MSLESCPTCGYALATFGNHCRHCSPGSFSVTPPSSYRKHLPQAIVTLVVMAILMYFIFIR